jgi:hypothetical protein
VPAEAAAGRDDGCGGRTPVTGIAHRYAIEATAKVGATAGAGRAGAAAAGRPPSAWTVIPLASKPTTTDPSRSVRKTRAPEAASRSRVDFAGWPYGLPAPAEAIATVGRVASTNACVVAVLLP